MNSKQVKNRTIFMKWKNLPPSLGRSTGFDHPESLTLDSISVSAGKNSSNSPLYKVGSATHSLAPMTLAAIDWLSISINLLLVIFVIVCFLMTLIILMQRPKQEGLGAAFGGGVTDQVFGARTTNVLQRGTVYLGSMFFILSLALAVLIGQKNKTFTMIRPAAKVEKAKPAEKPVEKTAPKSLSEELPAEEKAPAPTEAPKEAAPAPTPVEAPKEAAPATAPAPADATGTPKDK
jgi:preprotein translocase subunit SecG